MNDVPKSEPGTTAFKVIAGGCLGLVAAGGIIVLGMMMCTGGVAGLFSGASIMQEARQDSVVKAAAGMAPIDTLAPQELVDSFSGNSVAAERRYKGKPILLVGTMKAITGDEEDAWLWFDLGDMSSMNISCALRDEALDSTLELRPGDPVSVRGIYREESFSTYRFTDCIVLE